MIFFSICPSFFKLCLLQKKKSNSLADKCYTMFNRLFYFAIPLTLSKSPSRETTTTFNFATPTSKMASYPHINPVAICRNVNKLTVFTFRARLLTSRTSSPWHFFFARGSIVGISGYDCLANSVGILLSTGQVYSGQSKFVIIFNN